MSARTATSRQLAQSCAPSAVPGSMSAAPTHVPTALLGPLPAVHLALLEWATASLAKTASSRKQATQTAPLFPSCPAAKSATKIVTRAVSATETVASTI